ncbi:MAG: ParA family protein [Candidatus Helarchaeota archaeon]
MGIVISFINLKGGVGKTTCCANIAGEFARENRKVLVIDADPQANISTLLMGVEKYQEKFDVDKFNETEIIRQTIYQIFLDEIKGDDSKKLFDFNNAIIKSVVKSEVKGKIINPLPHLDLLPSTSHLMELEQQIVNYVRSRYAILNKYILKIKPNYDFILIDCPPNIYTTTHNSLYASDYYIIPVIPDFLSISGIPLLINSLNKTILIKQEERNETVKLAGILINLYDKRITMLDQGINKVKRYLNYFKSKKLINKEAILFKTKIRNLTDIKRASSKYLPICIYNPRSPSTHEFIEVCKEILEQIKC